MIGIGTAINDDPRLNGTLSSPHARGTRFYLLSFASSSPAPTARRTHENTPTDNPRPAPPSSTDRETVQDATRPLHAARQIAVDPMSGRRRLAIRRTKTCFGECRGTRSPHSDAKRYVTSRLPLLSSLTHASGRLDLSTLPRILEELGIKSLMVEGGAQIIHQFLTTSSSSVGGTPLVDLLVVTVAPVLVPNGLGVPGRETSVSLTKRWVPSRGIHWKRADVACV